MFSVVKQSPSSQEISVPMPYDSILQEAHQLNEVSKRLELLSAQHPLLEDALMTICGNIRNTATLLGVVVAIKKG